MKAVLIVLLLASAVRAEVFLGPTTVSNRLTLTTNEAIFMSALLNGNGYTVLATPQQTNVFLFPDAHDFPAFIAGPGEVVFTNEIGISFQRLVNSGIRMIAGVKGQTNVISVPAGKTLHFLLGNYPGDCAVRLGDKTAYMLARPGAEISGPAEIVFGDLPWADRAALVPFYFVENSVVMSGQQWLPSGTGNFQIIVERSADLQSWFPVIVHATSTEQKQFYRFRLTR